MRAELRGRPGLAVGVLTARRAARSGLGWGAVFGIYVASSALGYARLYPTGPARARLAATFGSDTGVAALIGPAHDLGTVAGFTEWRSVGVLGILGAVWGLLAGTRLLRGEEDAGRYELLLAGATTRRGAAGQAVAGLGAGALTLWAVTAAAAVAVGRSGQVRLPAGTALLLALTLVSAAAVFLVVGALAGQLAGSRRQAAALAAGVLGAAYALRLVADSGTGLEWLRWASPLSWAEMARPVTRADPAALLPAAVTVILLATVTVAVAGRRDLASGVLPGRDVAPARTGLLGGPAGLAVRLVRPGAVGWWSSLAAGGLVIGLVADAGGRALAEGGARRVAAHLGARSGGSVAYLGVALLIVAAMVALQAAGQVAAIVDEEASGRAEHLLVGPLRRSRWYAGRLAVAAGSIAVGGPLAAGAAWVGTQAQHPVVGVGRMLAAGVDLVPAAVLVLGVGAAAYGVIPRRAASLTYGLVAWSFLVQMLGEVIGLDHWVIDTSVLGHVAAAPAVSPDWVSAAALVALGAAGAVVGAVALSRRDLAGR